jgi:taurine dioxygenase
MAITLRPLSYALGAEVVGADLSAEMGNADFAAIHDAFLRHGVLLFRDQENLTREQHIAFSRRFGELDRHDNLPRDRHPEYPELLMVTNAPKPDGKPGDGKYTGHLWHSDMSFTLVPAMASVLRAIRVPPVGGDTMFANMVLAYEQLSAGMKRIVEGLDGIHTGSRKIVDLTPERAAESKRLNPPVAQPVVRVHPETGAKALYIGEKVSCFAGMTEAESLPIVEFLCRHAFRPQFVYRHAWQPNDVLMWDNRSTAHQALGDYEDGELRHLERTTIKGSPSGYVLA